MNKHILISAVGVVAVASIVYYLTTADERAQVGDMMTYDESAPENPSMGDGAHTADHMANDGATERAFLELMIPHHQEAVSTAKEVLERGGTLPEVTTLAEGIITAQEKEIADMKSWYKAWYGEEYQDKGSYTPMMGDLSSLSGAELDRAFLESMIEHHTGALMQAQVVAPSATHPETIGLAKAIAENQSNEIITMRILLKQIPATAE